MSMASVDPFPVDPSSRAREETRNLRQRGPADPSPAPRRAATFRDSAARPPPVEIAFLLNYSVPIEALNYATSVARRQGVSAYAVLLAEGIVVEEVFYRALADHLRVRFIEEDFDLAQGAFTTASQGYAPLRGGKDGLRWLFAPTGTEIFRLMSVARAAKGRPLFAVTTRTRFLAALRDAYPRRSRAPRASPPSASTRISACAAP
jgi:glycosyltransferase XagB